jgi:hypothetical protein
MVTFTSTINNSLPIELILHSVSFLQGFDLLNTMNAVKNIHDLVVHNMRYIIKDFISIRPYEKIMWSSYDANITLEQFKINLNVQEFVISSHFEHMIESINFNALRINPADNHYGQGMTNMRKFLFGMLYHNTKYLENTFEDERLEDIIYKFDKFPDDVIIFIIQVITLFPAIGDVEECEEDIEGICDENKKTEFLDYLHEMATFGRASNILSTFICYDDYELELFKDYCKEGMWSEHAMEFIDGNIIMTDQRKEIYFALVNRLDSNKIYECVITNTMRDLTINPLTHDEQQNLEYEKASYSSNQLILI